MTLDEFMIAHGDVVPTNGGEYVRETKRMGAIRVRVIASPMRAVWPDGVEPRGFDAARGVERSLRLTYEQEVRAVEREMEAGR